MLILHLLPSVSIVFAFTMNMFMITNNIHVNIHNNNYKTNSDYFLLPLTAFAQTAYNNKTQQWIDKENNAKIIFTYDPERPVIGKLTKLLFGIQNLRAGVEIKQGLHARIIITNGRDIIKIANSTFPDGNFSINYAFPDSGSYQVISKIDSDNYSEIASFNVFVPPQASSSTFRSFVSLMLYYVIPATSSAAGITIYLSHKKKI